MPKPHTVPEGTAGLRTVWVRRPGLGTAVPAAGWDWVGLGPAVLGRPLGLGTAYPVFGWDWTGTGHCSPEQKLSCQLKME